MMPESVRENYLEAMGIEVWYSKSALQSAAVSGAEATALSTLGEISSANIYLLQYPGCLVIFELADPVETLATGHQRLLDDLALALGATTRQSQLFREDWSLTSGEDPAQVIQRRAGQLIGDHNACVLVMGEIPRRLLFGDQIAVMMTTSFLGRPAIAAMGLDALLKDPISKRSLWLKMQEAR